MLVARDASHCGDQNELKPRNEQKQFNPGDRAWFTKNRHHRRSDDEQPKELIMANEKQEIKETTLKNTKLNMVKLDWKEVYYTNCPLVSASNVDEGLGLTKKEYKKIGVKYAYMRSTPLNDWYPHYIHNLDNLIRFGGLFPPIEVHADIRRTRLLGVTQMPAEGGVMMVRAKDDIFRMTDLKGKKIGISKSMNKIKNDWWRIQEHQGIELMLRMNGMTMADIELVEFPYADDWYNDPAMMVATMELSIDLWLKRDHKRDLAFRPLETALEKGVIDAMYRQSKVFSCLSEATGKFAAIEDLSRYPDWRLQVANIPAAITCTDVMAEKHPELAVTFMKGMIRAGRWANREQARRGGNPRPADVLPGRRSTPTKASRTLTWCRTCHLRTWPPSRSARTSC